MNEHKRPVGGGEPSVLPAKARWLDRGWSVYIKIALLAIPFCILFYDVFYKLVRKWTNDPTWSHGFLIPLFCLYFLNQKNRISCK